MKEERDKTALEMYENWLVSRITCVICDQSKKCSHRRHLEDLISLIIVFVFPFSNRHGKI